MSLLIITATSEDNVCSNTNRHDTIVISVTDASGNPVTTLAKSDFTVANEFQPTLLIPQLQTVAHSSHNNGIYLLTVTLDNQVLHNNHWGTNTYVFVVKVKHGGAHGQCVCNIKTIACPEV